jgi:hypothetical protein
MTDILARAFSLAYRQYINGVKAKRSRRVFFTQQPLMVPLENRLPMSLLSWAAVIVRVMHSAAANKRVKKTHVEPTTPCLVEIGPKPMPA